MFDLVNKCTNFVASVTGSVNQPEFIDDESSRDSGISIDVNQPSEPSSSSHPESSNATDSQQSAIFQNFEKEFQRKSRWTTSSESSEDYDERMTSLENDRDNLTPVAEPNSKNNDDTTPKEASLTSVSTDSNVGRKRSAPTSSLGFSPLTKRHSNTGESSHVADASPLNFHDQNFSDSFSSNASDATTPTSRRPLMRKFSYLSTSILKRRSEAMKSPDVNKVVATIDENDGDDDVFYADNEPGSSNSMKNLQTSLRPTVVNLSPIAPIDRFDIGNSSNALNTRRSIINTPTRRWKSGFEPSNCSTPSRDQQLQSPNLMHPIRPQPASLSFAKSMSLGKFEDSLYHSPGSRHSDHIYRLQPTTEDRITVERCPIAGGTLRDLLESKTGDTFNKEFILIDARYPYEYNGGHIRHAINAYDTSKIGDMFFPENEEAFKLMKSRIPIFYCEYSQARGPGMIAALRRLDRGRNIENYPNLDYPELYLLFGGYKSFYREFKKQNYCVPDKYVPMNHKKYKTELKKYNNHKSVHTQMKAKLVQKAGFHVKNRVFRQSFSSSRPKTPSSSDETKCEDSKTPRKGAKSELLHGVLEHAVGERSFLSVSQAKRYHDFDTTVEASDIESFVMSPSRPDRSVLPAASNKCPFDKSADEDASNLDQNDADNEDSTEGIQDLSDDGVQPIQLSFSSCL